MKVLLTTGNDYGRYDATKWLVSKDTMGCNMLTDNPALADIIIFAELHHSEDPYFRNVFSHEYYKKYPQKCVLYHDADLSITTLPTISPSIEKWQYHPRHKRSFHYIARVTENHSIDNATVDYSEKRHYLYSFIGSKTHPIRDKIQAIAHPRNTFILDTTGSNAWQLNDIELRQYEQQYLDVSKESYFILTPRGIGPNSYRLFESMQLGRVPVIISDAFVKIPNLQWDRFSITIPESKIRMIPAILNERIDDANEMGKLARKCWEDYFSPGVSLYHLVEAAAELVQHPYCIKDAFIDYSQFIRSPWHFKNLLRYKKNQLKSKVG